MLYLSFKYSCIITIETYSVLNAGGMQYKVYLF